MYRDPLSFSVNTTKDLAVSVREALQELGCDDDKLAGFDSYSTIKMEFDDCRDIHFSLEHDRLWLWSRFDNEVSSLSHYSQRILEMLAKPISGIETSQPVIGECEEGFEIKAMIKAECIDNVAGFSKVIDDFHTLVKRLPV